MRSTDVNLRLVLLKPFENEVLEQLVCSEYHHQKTEVTESNTAGTSNTFSQFKHLK